MLIVVMTIITLIVSFITSIISILMAMKLNQIPYMEPIQYNENLTLVRSEFLVANQVFLKENRIKIDDSINGNLLFQTPNTHLKLNSDQIEFYAKKQLSIKSKLKNNEILFPPDFNKIEFDPISKLTISNGITNLNKIRSPTDQNLEIQANNLLMLKGNNGLNLDGKQIDLKSEQILIKSLNSTINFDSENGNIYFQIFQNDKQDNKNRPDQQEQLESDKYQYKLCICANGLLFKIMAIDNMTKCSDVRFPVNNNPCVRQSRV